MDLRQMLPRLLPLAVAWAEAEARRAAATGVCLTPAEEEIARAVGVRKPGLVRIAIVDRLPQPADAGLRHAAEQAGLLGPGMIGLTLGYAVFICRGHRTRRLVSHELRHVHQYGGRQLSWPADVNYLGRCGRADSSHFVALPCRFEGNAARRR